MRTATRSIITVLISFAMMTSILMAQAGGRPQQGPPPGQRMPGENDLSAILQDLDNALDLSKEQSKQITDMYKAHFKEVKAAIKKDQQKQNKNRTKMEKMKKELDKDVKAILTPDQKKAFEAYLKEYMQQGRQGQGQQGPPRK